MTLLELERESPENFEQQQTASEPFFYNLEPAQQQVMALAAGIREYGVEGNEQVAQDLEEVLSDLEAILGQHEGWIIMAVTNPGKLPADYHVGVTEHNESLIIVPTSSITALSAHPRIYEDGHDTSPVLDLRIQTSQDRPTTHYSAPGEVTEQPSQGGWYQVPLESTRIVLLDNHPDPT